MNATHKVTVIIPYFGKLPSWLPLWMKSCQYNENYQWLIPTDDPSAPKNAPENVRFVPSTLAELKERAESVLGYEICLPHAYKLIDLKVAYGAIFREEIGDSTHWAGSDLDMIYGNLDKFFRLPERSEYVRLFHRGHFTIFRNTEDGRNLFRLTSPGKSHQEVMQIPYGCLFDEWNGLSKILEYHNIPVFHEEVIADINFEVGRLVRTREPNYPNQVFFFEKGAIYQAHWNGSATERKEWAYIHFQKRPMRPPLFDAQKVDSWYITPEGFVEKHDDPKSPAEFRLYNSTPAFFPVRFFARRVKGRVRRMISKRQWKPKT